MKKIINIILIILIITLFIVPGVLYIRKTHNDNLWLVVEKEVIEAAQKCINEDVCKENRVTIKYLIDNKYIDKIYNPVTKEVVNDSSYVEDNKLVIIK